MTGLWMTHGSTSDWKAASRDSCSIYDQGGNKCTDLKHAECLIKTCKYIQKFSKTGITSAHRLLCSLSSTLEITCTVCLSSITFCSILQKQRCMVGTLHPPQAQLHTPGQRIFHPNYSRKIKQMMKCASEAVTAACFYGLCSEDVSGFNAYKANNAAIAAWQWPLLRLRAYKKEYFAGGRVNIKTPFVWLK